MGRSTASTRLLKTLALCVAFAAPARAQTAPGDTAAVVGAVQRLFDAMASRDTAAARALMLPGASFVSHRGSGMPRRQSDSAFLVSLATGREKLLERMWAPAVRIHGPLAEVWAPYDFHIDGAFSHCGVDAFTLLRTDSGWRISSIVYTVERTGCPPSPLGPPKR
jgi:hypothetical protein